MAQVTLQIQLEPAYNNVVVGATPTKGPFSFNFSYFKQEDIKVRRTDDATGAVTELTLTSDYTVTGTAVVGGFSGGTITLILDDSDATLTIYRDISISRTDWFPSSGPFDIETLNITLAKLFGIAQELKEEGSRAIQLDVVDTGGTLTLPTATVRASKWLGFDASGDILVGASVGASVVVSTFMETVLDDTTSAAALTTLGVDSTIAQALGDAATLDQDDIPLHLENYLDDSEELDNASWTKVNATITADAVADSEGDTLADKIVETAATGNHAIEKNFTALNATAYNFSVECKAAERTFVRVRLSNTAYATPVYIVVNLSTGAQVTTSGGPDNVGIEDLGSGWYRIDITATSQAAGAATAGVYLQSDSTTVSYLGDIAKGAYATKLQVSKSNDARKYVRTFNDPITSAIADPRIPGHVGARFRTKSAAHTLSRNEVNTIFIEDVSGGGYTVTLPPIANLKIGDSFTFAVAADSTPAATDVLTIDGNASETIEGETTLKLWQRQWCKLTYNGTEWKVFSDPLVDIQVFTASGTWTKPTWLSDFDEVDIWLHGGGGGASAVSSFNTGGGGGGACSYFKLIGMMLPSSSYGVTVGAGGAGVASPTTAAAGGATIFATVLTAYGGGGGKAGDTGESAGAGGGGAAVGASGNGSTPAAGGKGFWMIAGSSTEGFGDCGADAPAITVGTNPGKPGFFGGGSGGDTSSGVTAGAGGPSFYGGGGGAGSANGTANNGGQSYLFGGNGGKGGEGGGGGVNGSNGTAPGGGGGGAWTAGTGGDGGDGQAIIICRRR